MCVLFTDSDNDKLAVLPTSTTGSLSSIITTSVASSADHDARRGRGGDGDGGGGGGGDGGADGGMDDDGEEKLTYRERPVIEEEWWKTTLQVSIPFFIAGIGTIGAGVILGRVEVSGDFVLRFLIILIF